jgi:lambda repressor-like predicted transcriptional regulator
MPLGVDLVLERKRRRLGKVEAAEAIGISFSSLKLAEAGGEPSRKIQDKIATFYGLDPLAIWPVEDEKDAA